MAWQLYVAVFPNGKRYFGITSKELKVRARGHRKSAKRGSPYPIHTALSAHGDAVTFQTLVVGERDYIHDLEIRTIEAFRTRDRRFGYNVTLGGDLNPMLTPECVDKLRGKKKSPEHCAAMSVAQKGRKRDRESVERSAAAMRGRKRPPEVCAAISAFHKGRAHTPEQIAKFIISKTGAKASDETKAKMSATHTGSRRSDKTKQKMSAILVGNTRSKGFKHTPETVAKRIATLKRNREMNNAADSRGNDRRDRGT